MNDCLERSRAVAGHFHHSNKVQLELKGIQERLITVATDVASESAEHVSTTRSIVMHITDCATRWNTSYNMFSRHMELEDAFRQCKRFNVNTADFELVKNLVKILKPFKTFTEKISRSDATLGDLLVCSKALCMTLNERYADDDKDVGSMREGMSKDFDSRFGDLEHVEVVQIATFLDPRYKEQYFSSEHRWMNANVDADNDLMATLIMLNESDDDDALGGDNNQDVAIEIERYRKKS